MNYTNQGNFYLGRDLMSTRRETCKACVDGDLGSGNEAKVLRQE